MILNAISLKPYENHTIQDFAKLCEKILYSTTITPRDNLSRTGFIDITALTFVGAVFLMTYSHIHDIIISI